MKKFLEKLLAIAGRNFPDILAFFVAILFFLLVSGYFITEKGTIEKLFATGAGFVGGMVGGGILGWIVGGIGVVAMGTGIGIGAVGAVVVGGIAGAILGTLTGASFSFVQMLRNPSDFNVNWFALLFVLIGAALVFFLARWLVRWLVHRVPAFSRRFLNRQGNI
jgi:hypothetical protein